MRPAISLDPDTATTRYQADDGINEELAHDATYREVLECQRYDYERMDVARKKAAPCAEVSWADAMSTADRLKHVSDLALTMELNRRGYRAAGTILSGKFHDSGKRKHKKKFQKRGN